jgi:putative transposase
MRDRTLPITVLIAPGAIVQVEGISFCICKFMTAESVLARNLETGIDQKIQLSEITESSLLSKGNNDLANIDQRQWETAYSRYLIILEVAAQASGGRKAVEHVAEKNSISAPTLYRWISSFNATGSVFSLLRKRRSDLRKTRVEDKVDGVVRAVITEEFLTRQKKTPSIAFTELKRRCRALNLSPISFPTFLKRIDEIAPEERAKRREQRHLASRLTPIAGALRDIQTPMAMIQIDHTLVDIELVDEVHRVAIGRPWITLAIDVATRMVVAWYVSLDPPGTLATGICIATAILPKGQLLANFGLNNEWPCQGLPGIVHVDNAREFRGNTLAMACQKYNFDLQFRHLKKPQYGAHIERLCGTLMQKIHALPGTTFSNPKEREGYDSARNSIFTLDEFNQWLANCILGQYHNEKHGSLGCAPIKKYNDGILGSDDQPGVGMMPLVLNADQLRIDFLPYEQRTVQATGIELNGLFYQSDLLRRWIAAKDPRSRREKKKFICRYDPRDISSILFFDPELEEYFRIPYRNPRHPAISLWELRAIKKSLAEKGAKAIDEDAIFSALNEMRRLEVSASEKTRKQRREAERRRQNTKSQKNRSAPIRSIKEPESSVISSSDYFDDVSTSPFEGIEKTVRVGEEK